MNKNMMLLGVLMVNIGVIGAAAAPAPGQGGIPVVNFLPGTPPPLDLDQCEKDMKNYDHRASDYLGGRSWAQDCIEKIGSLNRIFLRSNQNQHAFFVEEAYVQYLKEIASKSIMEVATISLFVKKRAQSEVVFRQEEAEENGILRRYMLALDFYDSFFNNNALVQQLNIHAPDLEVQPLRNSIRASLDLLMDMIPDSDSEDNNE